MSPGGYGIIGGLLQQVDPEQYYSHCGIMTDNFTEITHCTASSDRLLDNSNTTQGAPTDGYDPTSLKYAWPGTITQSVDDTFGENHSDGEDGKFIDPVTGKSYSIIGFKKDLSVINSDPDNLDLETLVSPLVIKPNPEDETNGVRSDLHKIADNAKNLDCYYNFSSYTDANIVNDPLEIAPSNIGWAQGRVPACCSTFIWHAAKTVQNSPFELEGILDADDREFRGAEHGSSEIMLDGLYFYSEEERQKAGLWLKNKISLTVSNQLNSKNSDFGVGLFATWTDVVDDLSNQFCNAFASNWTEEASKDSRRWENPGEGTTVSPDDLLNWDSPLYGYSEPLVYRPAQFVWRRKHVWKKVELLGSISGRATHTNSRGQTVSTSGAIISGLPDAKTAITSRDGTFRVNDVKTGRFQVRANHVINGLGWESEVRTVTINNGINSHIDLHLDPPDAANRTVTIRGEIFILEDDPGDERRTTPFSTAINLNLNTKTGSKTIKGYGEDETRTELTVSAKLNDDLSVDIGYRCKFFEGRSLSTNDLENTHEGTINIPRDARNIHIPAFEVHNDEIRSDDMTRVNLYLGNTQTP